MTEIVIEAGPQNASSDPTTGLRHYTWNGVRYPSVTSIRRIAGLPHGLHQWTLSQVIDRAVLSYPELTAKLTRERRPREKVLEKNREGEASRWLRAAATEERDRSASLGTAVHDAAAAGWTPDQVPDVVELRRDGKTTLIPGADIRPRLAQYREWLMVSRAEVLAAEKQAWNLTEGYAGSFDLIARFPSSGRIELVDIKTGRGLFAEHLLQVLAYRGAEFVGANDVVDEEATRLLHACTGVGVLHLADDHWTYHTLDATDEAWEAFLGLLRFARWTLAHSSMESVVRTTRTNRPVVTPEVDRRVGRRAA